MPRPTRREGRSRHDQATPGPGTRAVGSAGESFMLLPHEGLVSQDATGGLSRYCPRQAVTSGCVDGSCTLGTRLRIANYVMGLGSGPDPCQAGRLFMSLSLSNLRARRRQEGLRLGKLGELLGRWETLNCRRQHGARVGLAIGRAIKRRK